MNGADWEKVLERRLQLTVKVLGNKEKEYASDDDRLHNFKATAEMLRCTPAQALLGMVAKHLTSVVDAVKDEKVLTRQQWDEKLGDIINYMILLEGITFEEEMHYASLQKNGLAM